MGKILCITGKRVRQHETKALRKLRHPSTKLPAIFDVPNDLEETAETLCAELEELYKSPAFKNLGRRSLEEVIEKFTQPVIRILA